MKHAFVLTVALLFVAPAFVTLAADPAAAETVIKKTKHRGIVVKHEPGHPGKVVVKRPGPDRVIWRHPGARPGQFWHRGVWGARIHGPRFIYPHGWKYRRWAVGAILPALFLSASYYYDDYGPLGLQAPPPGYRWVRYGDDLLLINLRTGEVEDVAYDVFD